MTEPFAPRSSGADPQPTDIAGKLFPWEGRRPVLLAMPLSDDLYLPLFSTEEEMREVLGAQGIAFESIKKVDDPDQFMASILVQPRLRVIMNLRPQPDGRLLYTELRVGESAPNEGG